MLLLHHQPACAHLNIFFSICFFFVAFLSATVFQASAEEIRASIYMQEKRPAPATAR